MRVGARRTGRWNASLRLGECAEGLTARLPRFGLRASVAPCEKATSRRKRRLERVVDENGHEIAFGWDRFGLSSRLTAAGQLSSAKRGADGLVAEVSASVTGRVDRTVRREHDAHGRLTRVTYAKGEVETFAYDRWGRLAEHTRGKLKETYRYDHFGRLAEKDENGAVFSYAYDAWGRRTSRTIRFADGGEAQEERRSYDKYGRLVEIAAFGTSVKWRYDERGRVARQVVDGSPIDFAYAKGGRLAGKWLGGRESPDASVEYEYSKDGRVAARTANGVRQAFAYDARGQLVAVREGGEDVERYAYDKAGNMVRKTVRGRTTAYAFDGANQLVSSTCDGVTTRYAYDAAGRLVREGERTYRYGYLDKVLSVTDGKRSYRYAYHADGQLARADYGDGRAEDFAWDGLALVRRGDESFVNEPHVGGGNPVVSSKGAAYFNDILGTTVGVREGRGASRKGAKRRYTAAALTAFGEPLPAVATSPNSNIRQFEHSIISSPFFTGKPEVEGLGRVFLYRNYRADLAKWQTADPLGYPDGWNQLTYGCSSPFSGCDVFGTYWVECQASCWIQKGYADLVIIFEEGSSLNTGIPKSLFSALIKLIKEGYRLYRNEHPNLDKLINSYISAAQAEIGSDPITPSGAECHSAIARIMEPLGYKWEYVGKEVFYVDYSATTPPGAIEFRNMSVLWKISYKYRKWVEE